MCYQNLPKKLIFQDLTLKPDPQATEEEPKGKKEKKFTPVAFNKEVAKNVQNYLGKDLKKTTRTLYATSDKSTSVRCLVSESHDTAEKAYYWFAFHPHFKSDLESYTEAFVAFGCGSPDKIFCFKMVEFVALLDQLNTTIAEDRIYWHVHIYETLEGKSFLHRKGGKAPLEITDKLISSIKKGICGGSISFSLIINRSVPVFLYSGNRDDYDGLLGMRFRKAFRSQVDLVRQKIVWR